MQPVSDHGLADDLLRDRHALALGSRRGQGHTERGPSAPSAAPPPRAARPSPGPGFYSTGGASRAAASRRSSSTAPSTSRTGSAGEWPAASPAGRRARFRRGKRRRSSPGHARRRFGARRGRREPDLRIRLGRRRASGGAGRALRPSSFGGAAAADQGYRCRDPRSEDPRQDARRRAEPN